MYLYISLDKKVQNCFVCWYHVRLYFSFFFIRRLALGLFILKKDLLVAAGWLEAVVRVVSGRHGLACKMSADRRFC